MAKVFLFTGLSGSGKTTLAQVVSTALHDEHEFIILDGDELRNGINNDLNFSREDRNENIRRCGELAKLLANQDKNVILAIIAPYESLREDLRRIIGQDKLRIIHISCPLEVCVSRDPKQNYCKALKGYLKNYTGIGDIYEPPVAPHLEVNTHCQKITECCDLLVSFMRKELAES